MEGERGRGDGYPKSPAVRTGSINQTDTLKWGQMGRGAIIKITKRAGTMFLFPPRANSPRPPWDPPLNASIEAVSPVT